MTASEHTLLRVSLIVLWLGTTVVSVLDWQGAGSSLLVRAGVSSAGWIDGLIWAGSVVDAGIGLLLWFKPGRMTYVMTLIVLAFFTAVATCLLPALWLDPLGALLKNLPIAAMVVVLLQTEKPLCTAT